MPRRLVAAAATVLAAVALVFAATGPAMADPPADQSNAPSYWQTPGTNEVCTKVDDPGGTTWNLGQPPAGSQWTKVVIKSGSTGQSVDAENNAYYSDPTYKYPADAAGTTWNQVDDLQGTTFNHPSDKTISHVIYCSAPIPTVHVSGSASATDQTCLSGTLVNGVITVVITQGVVYSITGPSGSVAFDAVTGATGALAPGAYTVTVSAASGYTLDSATSIPLTIAAYAGDCAPPPVAVTGAASATDQVCTEGQLVGGVITVVVTEGVSYSITGQSGSVAFDAVTGKTGALPPGSYTVSVTAQSGYALSGPSSILLTIAPFDGGCGVEAEVAPVAAVTDQTCQSVDKVFELVGGVITVGNGPGIDYTITGPSGIVAFNATTRQTAELPPGTYTVHPQAQTGFTLTDKSDIVLVVHAYHGDCGQLQTHPGVDPSAASSDATCTTVGSYTLTSDQLNPAAVIWTVNGSVVAAGTHTVTTPGTYHVHADPGPGFGINEETRTDWTFTFTAPGACDLKTLALTGQDPTPVLGAAVLFGLLGVVLVRAARRGRREA
jgi:hypothetical protein